VYLGVADVPLETLLLHALLRCITMVTEQVQV
jgi:hypothetical protein